MESARPTKVKSVNDSLVGRKLRVAGRMLAYDVRRDTVLLGDEEAGVLVNVGLCIENSGEWGREPMGVVMVVGYLERVASPVPVPEHNAVPDVAVDAHLVLDALLVTAADDLDLAVWNGGVDALGA